MEKREFKSPYNYACISCKQPCITGMCAECSREANDRFETITIEAPTHIITKIKASYSGDTLMKDKARSIVAYKGKLFLLAGGLLVREVVLAENFEGETYDYGGCHVAFGTGGPFAANNHLFKCKGKEYVILPDIQYCFEEIREEEQASLF